MKHQTGMAKARFIEQYNKAPWLSPHRQKPRCWPFLQHLFNLKRINELDIYLVNRLMDDCPEATEEVAFLLCHLFLAAKEGHLCIQITRDDLEPSVHSLWNANHETVLSHKEASQIADFIQNGYTYIQTHSNSVNLGKKFIFKENRVYLHKHWKLETRFLEDLSRFIRSEPNIIMNEKIVEAEIKKDKLNPEQRLAVKCACDHPLSIISGGPGTGKTYTAGRLIRLLWQQLSEDEQTNFEIVVAAPTGKAAANLQKSLTEATQDLDNFPKVQSKTLHSLLNLNDYNPLPKVYLNADLLIIDESSMIDLKMMSILFHGLKSGSRVVLIGDHCQLPSIEAGNLFADLISLPSIPKTELINCLRAELKAIVDLASLIKSGRSDHLIQFLNTPPPGILRSSLNEESRQSQKAFVRYVTPLFPSEVDELSSDNIQRLLNQFQSIRILAPAKKGMFGVDALNGLIWQEIQCKWIGKNWVAIPILITANDYKQDLFNGETGVLIKKLPLEKKQPHELAYFPCRSSSTIRSIPSILLPNYEMAYCLSVHKSQGSEFDRVILVMPSQTEQFGRELLYTAVTRAKKQIEIFASDETLIQTTSNQKQRLSGIAKRFSEISS